MFRTWIFVWVCYCNNIFRIIKMKKETKFGTNIEKENDSTKLTSDKIKVFVERLKKIGIEVKLVGNYPWVYIDEICGKKVTQRFNGNHGFTLIFLPSRLDSPVSEFTDIKEIFKLIRKYVEETKLRMKDSKDELDDFGIKSL